MSTMGRRKCIIDVDTGVDDAQALILALSCPDIDVVAVTCVAGNVGVEQVCLNTLTVLTVCDRLDVPVYKGSARPLIGTGIDASFYHGVDGLGDASLGIEVDPDSQLQKEHAVIALTRLVNTYPGEIILITLAPLTNIALAIRLDPNFGKKLHSITLMGGNIEGKGNCTVSGEFNFAADPEAAYVVLNEISPTIIHMNSWEMSQAPAAGLPWSWLDEWMKTDTPVGRFNQAISQKVIRFQRIDDQPFFRSCDLNAMVTVVDSSTVLETEDIFASVELAGNLTRGQMVVDWKRILGKPPNVRLIKLLDTDKARKLYDKMLSCFK